MSTKDTLFLYNYTEPLSLHVYLDMIDDCYYIEDIHDTKIKITKSIAHKIAQLLDTEKGDLN